MKNAHKKYSPILKHLQRSFPSLTTNLFLLIALTLCNPFESFCQRSSVESSSSFKEQALKPYPYGLEKEWSDDLEVSALSPEGNWALFSEYFSTTGNKMHLKQTQGEKEFLLPQGIKSKFSGDNRSFGLLTDDHNFVLVDLQKQIRTELDSVKDFDFSHDGRYLALMQQNSEGTPILSIRNLHTGGVHRIGAAHTFDWNPAHSSMLFVTEGKDPELWRYDATKRSLLKIEKDTQGPISSLKWNDSGSAAILVEETPEKRTIRVYTPDKTIRTLETSVVEGQFPRYRIADKKPFLSKDGKTVLFFRKEQKDPKSEEEGLEVWNTTDPLLYPDLKIRQHYFYAYLLTAWFPERNEVRAIATPEFPTAEMDIEHSFALVYNELQYGPQHTEFRKADIYIKDVATGKTRLAISKQTLNEQFSISPAGKFVTYFKDGDWWNYDTKKGTAHNLTAQLPTNFQNREGQLPKGRVEIFGKPAWTARDSLLILTDANDLWAVHPHGKNAQRITRGREKGYHYELKRLTDVEPHYRLTVGISAGRELDLEKGSLLRILQHDTHSSGLALLETNLSVRPLVFDDTSIFRVFAPQKGNAVIYRTESTTLPMALHYRALDSDSGHVFYQSNQELLKYELGQKTFLTYSAMGENHTATLLYPANYDPSKKYPMVVTIYEKTSENAMEFVAPHGYVFQGFSRLAYTSNGYFVFMPNLTYEIGNPGRSALECVNAAVDKVLENPSIDATKMALIGHSFGGYETAFIATQTDRFATYVAGAAVTDFTSHYHDVNWNGLSSDLWRYEDQQWRMGQSYYKNKKGYLRNSPLEYVESIKKPILLWTGDKDYIITWTQSLELFMAMRRLHKEASLILVKDEGHSPWYGNKQLLLSKQIKIWLDRYCK